MTSQGWPRPIPPMTPETRAKTKALLDERMKSPEFRAKVSAVRRRVAEEFGEEESPHVDEA